jgi:hypothetical protein
MKSRCLPQRGHDLAARMWDCFQVLCGEGCERVLMIGADVPHVKDEWLDEAEDALRTCDLVLGPTDDGGYYLVAMHEPHDVFTGVAMGTSRVLAETLRRAAAGGLRVHLLPRFFDIDELGDVLRLRALLTDERCGLKLPRTMKILAEVCETVVTT